MSDHDEQTSDEVRWTTRFEVEVQGADGELKMFAIQKEGWSDAEIIGAEEERRASLSDLDRTRAAVVRRRDEEAARRRRRRR